MYSSLLPSMPRCFSFHRFFPLSPSVHPNPPPYFSPLFRLSRRPIVSFHDPCFLMDDWCNPRSNSPSQTGTLRSLKLCSLPQPRREATSGNCQFQHRACHHLSEAPRPTVRLRRFLPEEWLVRPLRLAAAAEVHISSLHPSPMQHRLAAATAAHAQQAVVRPWVHTGA